MAHDHPKSDKTEDSQSPSNASPVAAKIQSLLSWIARWITKEAKEAASESQLQSRFPKTIRVHVPESFLPIAQKALDDIDRASKELIGSSGSAAIAFVDRFVEPVLSPLRRILNSSKNGEESAFPAEAVSRVELVSLLKNSKKIIKKIFDLCVEKEHLALLEDLQFLKSYSKEALSGRCISHKRRWEVLEAIRHDLSSILERLENLLQSKPVSHDILAVFTWKSSIDNQRQQLHDKAIEIIEEHVRVAFSVWESTEEGDVSIDPFLKELDLFVRENPPWPLALPELEETAARLRGVLERQMSHARDERVRSFFNRMKTHYELLEKSGISDDYEDMYDRLQEEIRRIESLLE